MKIIDTDATEVATAYNNAIEIQSDDGEALFRLRLVGSALDVASPPNEGKLPSGAQFDFGMMIISPVSNNRVIVRRERRERPRP